MLTVQEILLIDIRDDCTVLFLKNIWEICHIKLRAKLSMSSTVVSEMKQGSA